MRVYAPHEFLQQFYSEYLLQARVDNHKETGPSSKFIVSLCLAAGYGVARDLNESSKVCWQAAQEGSLEARAVVQLIHDINVKSVPSGTPIMDWIADAFSHAGTDDAIRRACFQSLKSINPHMDISDFVLFNKKTKISHIRTLIQDMELGFAQDLDLKDLDRLQQEISDGKMIDIMQLGPEINILLRIHAGIGDSEFCRKLLNEFCADIDSTTPQFGFTPLSWALYFRNFQTAEMLVREFDANICQRDCFGRTIFHLLAMQGVTEQEQRDAAELIYYVADINSIMRNGFLSRPYAYDGLTPVMLAIEADNAQTLRALLEIGASLDDVFRGGPAPWTALKLVSHYQSPDLLKVMINSYGREEIRNLIEDEASNDMGNALSYLSSTNSIYLQIINGNVWKERCAEMASILINEFALSPYVPPKSPGMVGAALSGNIPLLKQFFEVPRPSREMYDRTVILSLGAAIRNENLDVFNLLLEFEPNIQLLNWDYKDINIWNLIDQICGSLERSNIHPHYRSKRNPRSEARIRHSK